MKMNPPGDHLTDEQISDLLDGLLANDGETAAHLAACATCAARLGDLRALRGGLRALRDVGAMPDFRLGAGGTPPRAATPRVPHPGARAPLATRFVGVAALLCGLALLVVAGFSSTRHVVPMAAEAGGKQSVAAPCSSQSCPAAGMYPTPSTDVGATPIPSPTAPPLVHSSPSASSPAPFPVVPVEWALGVVLTLGGGVVLARRRGVTP